MDGLTPPDQNSSVTQPQPKAVAIPVSVIDPTSRPEPEPQAHTEPQPTPPPNPEPPLPPPPSRPWQRPLAIALIVIALTAGGVFAARLAGQKTGGGQADATQRFGQQSAPLGSLSKQLGTVLGDSNVLTVNGRLQVAGAINLVPESKPTDAIEGELYYDQSAKQVGYYNGKGYVYLQGGGNTFVTNNITNAAPVTNNITNNNVTNVTNVSGGGGGVTGSGTPGTIAMFTAAGALGDSLLSQSGNTLATAATSLQGGAVTGLSILTADAAGTSGDLTLQSGNSSTASSGTVTLDTGSGVVNGTVIKNDTFETGVDGFTGAPYGTVVAQTNAAARTGSFSLAVPLSLTSWSSADDGGVTVTPGHEYRWSAWVRADTASAPVVTSVYFRSLGITGPPVTVNDTVGAWTQVSVVFVNPTGNTLVDLAFVYQKNTNEMHYIDDVTLTDLNAFTGLTVNLGTTNAQAVNLGNSGQAGDTTITGGATGVKVKDTAGGVFLSAAADSSFTTSGNLLLQGGAAGGLSTGGVSINTTPQAGTSGNIIIQSGASSTTSAGNVTVDTGANTINGVTEEDFTFESASDVGKVNDFLNGTYTVTQDCTAAHLGSCSLNMNGFGTGGGSQVLTQQYGCPGDCFAVTAGHKYTFSMWVKAATTADQIYASVYSWAGCNAPNTTDSTSAWTNIVWTCTAPVGLTGSYFRFGFNSPVTVTHYFDDISATDISASTVTAELNLGATNAQAVAIGNGNETGLTSIQGGSGIDINSGFGSLNLAGGATSINAGGPLTLTAAATSTWSINSGGNGGDLAIQAGSSSTASNAGNLILQPGANTGTGAAGSVIVKPQTDSAAFQVQNSVGTNLLGVDTLNNTVTLGKVGSVGASTYGRTDVGAQQGSGYFSSGSDLLDSQQFTATGNDTLTTLSTYIGPVKASPHDQGQMAIYADNGSNAPGAYVASTAVHTLSPTTWNTWDITSGTATLTNGNKYWLVYWTNDDAFDGNNAQYYDTGVAGATNYIANYGSGVSFGTGPSNGMPTTMPGGVYLSNYNFSIYATSGGSTSVPLTISANGSLTDLGQATFHDTMNSATAFQIQNSTGGTLFNADTAGSNINLGTSTFATTNIGSVSGTIGYSSAGATQSGGAQNLIAGNQYTATATGTISSMSAFIGPVVEASPNNQYQMAIYADDGTDNPGAYIASTSVATITTNAWNTLPISASLTAGTKYWLVYWTNSTASPDNDLNYDTVPSLTVRHAYTTGQTFGSGPSNGMPATFPAPSSNNAGHLIQSIYANYSTSTGPAVSVGPTGAFAAKWTALFQDSNNSTTAFQIQNATGVALLTADTTTMTITVQNLVVTANLTVNGHIITGGTAPTFSTGAAAACSGGASVGVTGNDTSGTVSITTGTGPCSATGGLINVTFASAFASTPHVVLTPAEPNAATLQYYYTSSTTGFTVSTGVAPAPATTYNYTYLVVQ